MKPRRLSGEGRPQVRWRQGNRWRYGYLKGLELEADGSLRVYDNYTGGARSLPATEVQRESRGPRGGRRWEWVQEPLTLTVVSEDPARPLWRSEPGKAELFNQLRFFAGAAA